MLPNIELVLFEPQTLNRALVFLLMNFVMPKNVSHIR
jgi:hypothetical protein